MVLEFISLLQIRYLNSHEYISIYTSGFNMCQLKYVSCASSGTVFVKMVCYSSHTNTILPTRLQTNILSIVEDQIQKRNIHIPLPSESKKNHWNLLPLFASIGNSQRCSVLFCELIQDGCHLSAEFFALTCLSRSLWPLEPNTCCLNCIGYT